MMVLSLGLDLGASSAKAVLMDDDLRVVGRSNVDSRTFDLEAFQRLLASLVPERGEIVLKLGVTGVGRELFRFPEGTRFVNEVIALAQGSAKAHPGARSVLEVGGQSSRWIQLDGSTQAGPSEIVDFALNEKCAAGAGAFLEQQAGRLKLDIEAFSKLAASAQRKAKIAGRCSVFAKSDMIHLQQKGTPVEDIAYGLCLALVRNFAATTLKGKDCPPPVLLTGGGALNGGLVRAFQEVLGFSPDQVVVAPAPLYTSAVGAALVAAREASPLPFNRVADLGWSIGRAKAIERGRLAPLGDVPRTDAAEPSLADDGDIDGFLGIDVGSVSTDLVIIDRQGEVLAGSYVPTAGRPLQALQEAYAALLRNFKGTLRVHGIGTTGSGRYLAGRILDAEVIHNEITCQMTSALRYFPQADTVFEIGGQDSKFISLRSGRLHDFTMNKVCAAGTGSFLEEQASLLNISIVGEFSDIASRSTAPHNLGSRCTVFMETELVNAVSRGVPVPDIAAGLAYSVAKNYLEKVVAPKPIGRDIVFQGGVASNAAVVKAFASILGRPIHVHPHNRISGAIGAALMAWDAAGKDRTSPRIQADLDRLFGREYRTKSFECRQCSNRCSVNRISFNGQAAYFGDTCERYTAPAMSPAGDVSAGIKPSGHSPVPEPMADRERLWARFLKGPRPAKGVIGIPRVSYMLEYLPFWAGFFGHLGYCLELSPASDMALFEEGLKKLPAEICLPAKVAFGHLLRLQKSGVSNIFFPSIFKFENDADGPTYPCPYGELLPFIVRSTLDMEIIAPELNFSDGRRGLLRGLKGLPNLLDCSPKDLAAALDRGAAFHREFQDDLIRRGRALLKQASAEGRPVFAILGRPYNVYDVFLNLNLAHHLAKLGVPALPYDYLPLESAGELEKAHLPVWKYNRKVIRGARWCVSQPGVFPVVLTNFGCGPDAFGLKHVSRILRDKPHLVLEFDEHQAEAGLITRLEAFRDEVRAAERRSSHSSAAVHIPPPPEERVLQEFKEKKVYLPHFADHAHAFAGAMKAVGIDAELLPPPDAASIALGEEVSSGKECHVYAIIAGDLVKLARSRRVDRGIFFFPGAEYACLLQQYGTSMNFLLKDLGADGLRVVSPIFDFTSKILGLEGLKWLWRGLVAVDSLVKESCRIRAYEIESGLTDRVHQENLRDVELGLAVRDLSPSLLNSANRLRSISVRDERWPVVGVAGDIYTRLNSFANSNLFHRLEDMGCEVWPAPFMVDEADFDLQQAMALALRNLRLPDLAATAIMNIRKEVERARVRRLLDPEARDFIEPGYKAVLAEASRYLGRENNPVVLLNIAKMVDYTKRGADGVVNVICFNCMLGTVSSAMAERIRRDHGHIPMPTLVYSGSDSAAERTRLEAFVYQVKRFAQRRNKSAA